MREVNVDKVTENIKEMCIEANHFLTDDMKKVFKNAVVSEKSPLGKQVLNQLNENLDIAVWDNTYANALKDLKLNISTFNQLVMCKEITGL